MVYNYLEDELKKDPFFLTLLKYDTEDFQCTYFLCVVFMQSGLENGYMFLFFFSIILNNLL